MGAVMTALVALIGGAAWCHRQGLAGEYCRKIIHVGMALNAASFPWLFQENWPVLTLAGGATVCLLAIRFHAGLRQAIGTALHDVVRHSIGDLLFPWAVALAWLLSGQAVEIYVPAMLILGLGDAAAALVGKRFGRHGLICGVPGKTAEGSLAFLVVAMAVLLAALLPSSGLAIPAVVPVIVVTAVVAGVAMFVEGISSRGWDNLWVPLIVVVLLVTLPSTDAQLHHWLDSVVVSSR
jgi:phytol kinase